MILQRGSKEPEMELNFLESRRVGQAFMVGHARRMRVGVQSDILGKNVELLVSKKR
jgi:hypothetical protein